MNFDGEPITCELLSRDGYTEFEISYENLHFTMQFADEADFVRWCNAMKELAIEKMNDAQ